MTLCVKGNHEFPIEDENGAYCEEHGIALYSQRQPLTDRLRDGAPSGQLRPVPPQATTETSAG